jgi:type IV pilus assembly protein PilQ
MKHRTYLIVVACVVVSSCAALAMAAEKDGQAPKASEQKTVDPEQQVMSPLDVKDADIQDVIRTISKGYNLNIILDKDVTGKVTVHLSDVPVIEGLRTLARSNGLEIVKEGNVYRIRKTEAEQRSIVSFAKGKLTVDVQNMDVRDFLKDISAKTAISIVPDAKVEGKISGKLYQVELDDGLRALVEGIGLKLVKRKNIYQVITGGEGQSPSSPGMPNPYMGYRRGGTGGNAMNVEYSNGLISLDVTNGNLQDVIKAIADQSDMQIITYGMVSGDINAKLKSVPLTEALALLLGGTMFTFVQKDSIILIGDRNAATPSGQALSKSELIHLNNIKADGVLQVLPKDIPPNNVKVIKEQNALLVSGTSEDIVSVHEFLKSIDIPTPQVAIDAVIIEYSENLNKDFGIKASQSRPDLTDKSYMTTPTPDFALMKGSDATELGASGSAIRNFLSSTFGLGPTNTLVERMPPDFFLFIRYLETQNKAKVLAQPSIVTLNGNKASINVNETQYFKVTTGNPLQGDYSIRFQPITFGIKLDITPWISKGGQITAEISPEVSNSSGSNADGYPNVSTRSILTTVRLNDGQTIILGGLVKNQETEFRAKIPILGDIPLLGALFRHTTKMRTKSNLVVYITPHVLTKESVINLQEELKNLDKNSKEFMDRKLEESMTKSLYDKKKPPVSADSSEKNSAKPQNAAAKPPDAGKTMGTVEGPQQGKIPVVKPGAARDTLAKPR